MAYNVSHIINLGHMKSALEQSHGEVADFKQSVIDTLEEFSENVVAGNVREFYAICGTAAGTAQKEISIDGLDALKENDIFHITFTNAQTYNGAPTLKVNAFSAYNIRRLTGSNAARYEWSAGETLTLIWNGTYFLMVESGMATTTYYGRTKLYTGATSTSAALALTPATLNNLAQSMIAGAEVYSAKATYAVGALVRYGYLTYKCISAITTAEAWNAAHWEALPALQAQIDAIPQMTLAQLMAL